MPKKNFYLFLYFTIPILYFWTLPISTGDLGVWIAHGLYFLDNGEILRNDVFSILTTKSLIYPAWGSSIIYALIYKVGGLKLIFIFNRLIYLLCQYLIYILYLKKNKVLNDFRNLVVILIALYGLFFNIDRPAMFGIPFFIISYYILDKGKYLKFLPIMSLVWINLHGSAFLLPLMMAWKGLSLQRKDYLKHLVLFSGVVIALFINPFSWKIFPYALETAAVSKARMITEWCPTFLAYDHLDQLIVFIIMMGFVMFRLRMKLLKCWKELFFFLVIFSLSAIRNTVWPIGASIMFLAHKGAFYKSRSTEEKRWIKYFNELVMALVLFLLALGNPYSARTVLEKFGIGHRSEYNFYSPEKIVKIIEEKNIQGPIFNQFEFGSYFILKLKNKIFMDTRNVIYSDQQFREYKKIISGIQSIELLKKYNMKIIAVESKAKQLIDIIQKNDDWNVLFYDGKYFLAIQR